METLLTLLVVWVFASLVGGGIYALYRVALRRYGNDLTPQPMEPREPIDWEAWETDPDLRRARGLEPLPTQIVVNERTFDELSEEFGGVHPVTRGDLTGIPIVVDPEVPPGKAYFLNTDYRISPQPEPDLEEGPFDKAVREEVERIKREVDDEIYGPRLTETDERDLWNWLDE